MDSHLFVYGTLLSSAMHPKGARLRSEGRLVGQATIRGRLYRVSWYPALVEDATAGPVHGEVYVLNAPAASLEWLDTYEMIVPGDEANGEYRRVERSVQLASGCVLTAWVYLYQKPVAGFEFVPDGRWTLRPT